MKNLIDQKIKEIISKEKKGEKLKETMKKFKILVHL